MHKLENISQVESKDLAAYVVLYKSLGMHKEIALICMQELSDRRASGDAFEFEKFIEEELKKLPKYEGFDIKNIISLIDSASKGDIKNG